MKLLLTGLLLSGMAAAAQTAPTFTTTCQPYSRSGNQQRACETRDLTLPAPAGQPLTIDAGANGNIRVQGWDGADVRVRAKVEAWGSTETEAQARLQATRISTSGNTLQAVGRDGLRQVGVSYEVFVPRRTALALNTVNGNVDLASIRAAITFRVRNGNVSLSDLGGQVTGQATNGNLSIALNGRQWDGEGLDVQTVNGNISWRVPTNYSAQFVTGTTNGSLSTTLPQRQPQGNQRTINTTLSQGGRPVKAVTTNGEVLVKQG